MNYLKNSSSKLCYLFIVTIYLKTVSVTQTTYGWMRLNGDSKRIWKELVIDHFKDLPWNLSKGNKEKYKNLHKNRWCPIQELN